MNKRQKEVAQAGLDAEKKIIRELKQVYGQAKKDCEAKIRELSTRTDMENLQSIIYQKQYQEALKKQLDGILDNLNSQEFMSISDYLQTCYQNGYTGTMYDLAGQGIPMTLPINQEQIVKALQTDSKISEGLYKRLGEDTKYLKTSIRAELSRGISNGSSWNDIAVKIATGMNSPFDKAMNRAKLIARTEGHRVQCESSYDAMQGAKEKGADVVKQWDATLDAKTRPTHQQIDGQIRELDEPFESPNGKAMYPGNFGVPAEDCNCRCAVLQRARWALSEKELQTLKDRASYFGLDKTEDFNDFKQKYLKLPSDADTMDISEPALQSVINDYLNGKVDRKTLGESILKNYGVENVPVNVSPIYDYGVCNIRVNDGIMEMVDYNLKSNDSRDINYQIKTAFHEAYHAKGNGKETDYSKKNRAKWLKIEETFAETSAHYSSSSYGITDLTPAYPDYLVSTLPRLKQLDEFSDCSTLADFGKVALELKEKGGSVWSDLSRRAMKKKYNYGAYVQEYFPEISKDVSGYVDKIIENMPQCKSFKSNMENDLKKGMENIQNMGFALSDNETLMINNAVAIAMNRIGVK